MNANEWFRSDRADLLKEALETGRLNPNQKDILGDSLMHTAGKMGAARCVPVLVEFMAEPWENDDNMGWSPIMNAVWADRFDAAEAMLPYIGKESVHKACIAAEAIKKKDMGLWLMNRWEALAIEKQTAPGKGAALGKSRL